MKFGLHETDSSCSGMNSFQPCRINNFSPLISACDHLWHCSIGKTLGSHIFISRIPEGGWGWACSPCSGSSYTWWAHVWAGAGRSQVHMLVSGWGNWLPNCSFCRVSALPHHAGPDLFVLEECSVLFCSAGEGPEKSQLCSAPHC